MNDTLSIEESAKLLGTSTGFVESMIAKGRLTPDATGCVEREQLVALSELVAKLKQGGIAAMVSAVDNQL